MVNAMRLFAMVYLWRDCILITEVSLTHILPGTNRLKLPPTHAMRLFAMVYL